MPNIIFHHYKLSPFSQKIRSMFGYTNTKWSSVITKEMPPRKKLHPLIGHYRKIPVAQIGADIFCDTRTIAAELAKLSGISELDQKNLPQEQQDFIAYVDMKIFFACIMCAPGKQLNKKAMQSLSWVEIGKLLLDRISMGRSANVKIAGKNKSKRMLEEHLITMEEYLGKNTFLFAEKPTAADFSAYHSLWFLHFVAEKPVFKAYPKVLSWIEKIAAYGDGESVGISAEKALEIAKESHPRKIPAAYTKDSLIGSKVRVSPADYGLQPTSGVLVGSSPDQWIVQRVNDQVGKVNVHFPKRGYALAVL